MIFVFILALQIYDRAHLRQTPHYSGDMEKVNNGFKITISKRPYGKPPLGQNNDIQIRTQTITR